MHKLKIKVDHYIIAVGMSIGSIALIEVKLNENNEIDAKEIHRI
jgi:energy-converting hydrogenase Eha subunit G